MASKTVAERRESLPATELTPSSLGALAAEINLLHDEAERHATTAVVYAARCGDRLLKAKVQVVHGQWLDWLAAHCKVERSQAAKYMRLAREMPELLDPNGCPGIHLPGIKHAIALLSADDEVKAEVHSRLAAGETVTVQEIERLKREHSAREAELQGTLSGKQAIIELLEAKLAEKPKETVRDVVPEDYEPSKARVTALETSIEQTRQEAQTAKQRVDELREELAHRERQKTYAIREGIQNGLAARQAEVDALNRAIEKAEAELTDYRQRLKDRTGAEHENQRLHLDTEKALRELMVLGTTLNLFECEVIYTINWEQLDRLTQVAEAIVPLIQQFKATHRQAEKPVAQAA
ncbi:MAG: DUF3102 domain-containing protein [Gammaproteobacteria bacterium]|nr:DUF3102 domain-containing protein [Gammaproteobacteria bacterium]